MDSNPHLDYNLKGVDCGDEIRMLRFPQDGILRILSEICLIECSIELLRGMLKVKKVYWESSRKWS